MWHFGIRREKDGEFVITEEYPQYGYVVIGKLESYSKKELKLIFKDILYILEKGKIKKVKQAKIVNSIC